MPAPNVEETSPPAASLAFDDVPIRSDTLDALVRGMPKVELHAHLSGSISQAYLAAQSANFRSVDVVTPRSLAGCFEYFVAVSRVITDIASLKAATREVFADYANEHCVYLELRTTPKRFATTDDVDYVAAVRDVAGEFQMQVKLLLSLDRGKVTSLDDAKAKVKRLHEIAAQFPNFVVGLDVSGDPRVKTAPFILEALREARLPTTFHSAEIQDDDEASAIVDHVIDHNIIRRLGHCCYLPPTCRTRLPDGIGIELCPTSNLVAMQLDHLDDHHFPLFFSSSSSSSCSSDNHQQQLLSSINCDDRG